MDAYNLLIRFGRMLYQGHKFKPELTISTIKYIERELRWTPVEDFFKLFPPIKNHRDDGTWDYKSTNDMIKMQFGERFGKDDFKHLLMTACYENKFVRLVGLAYVLAISELRKRQTGTSLMEEFIRDLDK